MITNEVIKKEIEDLRKNLILNELEIPSFFSCIWPAIFFALIFTGVPFFLFSNDIYTDDIDLIAVTVFGCFLSVVFFASIGNARALFLSVPRKFRRNSKLYAFWGRKVWIYLISYAALYAMLAVYISSIYFLVIWFIALSMILMVVMAIIMNVDFGRYQLSALTSLIESFKNKKGN